MFEPFSRAYYLGRLYVEPRDDAVARMCHDQYRRVATQLYGDEESPTRPLVMKLGTRHFPVHGESAIPADTLSVPPAVLDDTDVHNPPSLREVLLASADRAGQLLRLTNGTVDEGAVPPDADGPETDPTWRPGPDGPAGI